MHACMGIKKDVVLFEEVGDDVRVDASSYACCEDSGSSILCFLVSKDLILILIFSQFALGGNHGVMILALQ